MIEKKKLIMHPPLGPLKTSNVHDANQNPS
jgi:hypothetical protein